MDVKHRRQNQAKHESSTYWSSLTDPSNLRPNLKPESLQLGSALGGPEAEGASGGMELALDPPGTRADPRGTRLDLPFLVTKEEPPLLA